MTTAADSAVEFRFAGTGTPGEGFDRYDRLRADHDVLRITEPEGSYWLILKRELIRACLQDTETFSSVTITPLAAEDGGPKLIPINLDPPEHRPWRQLLAGYFSPRQTAVLRDRMTEHCRELIGQIAGRDECDVMPDFATRFPTVIFLELLGLPVAELDQFLAWEQMILRGRPGNLDQRAAMSTVMGYLHGQITARRATGPVGDDILSEALSWEVNGVPVPDEALLSCCVLLFLAGLDTVTNTLAFSFHHLATHPDDRHMVAAIARDGGPMADVVEEMLRYYAIPAIGRKATRDTELAGQRIRAGEVVVFPLAAGNRDPDFLPDGGEVRLDRSAPPPHLAFGAGPHRCLGSHLAREELAVALGQWHALLPDYTLRAGGTVTESWGPVHGLNSVPLTFTAG
jgi:cytochrome P450